MSERWVWSLLALLALAGIGTSSYLTYSHYADQATVCAGIGSCEFVQTSEYSKVAGVPVALLGLLFFVALEGLAALRLLRFEPALQWGQPAAFAMTLGGLAFVSYLSYVELFVIDAICIWCVATAGITLACFLVAAGGTLLSISGEEEEPA
ncbi:MAG: vitamin K epoxide reductase family protein [Chloroflexota bacterium]